MGSINLKINEIVNHFFSGNNSEFAKKVGTSEANIRNYREKTVPKFDFIEKLFEKIPEINPNWLLTGKGKMLKDTSIESIESIESINKVKEQSTIYNKVDYKEKYYQILEDYHKLNEDNRELRLKINKQAKELEELKETHQKQVQEIEKCKKELEKSRKEKNSTAMLPV